MADLTDIDYELISAYLDEMLSADERAALEARLHVEPALRAALGDLRVVQQAVASLPVMPAPRDFRLTRDMLAPAEPARAPLKLKSSLRRAPWWATAAAVALLLVGGGLFLLTDRAPEPPPIMIAAAPTELASPTVDEPVSIAPAGAVPIVPPPLLTPTRASELRQFEATTETIAPLAMQAAPPGADANLVPESAPMLAAAPEAAEAAEAADLAQTFADDSAALSPQALLDGLSALLRLLLQVFLER